MNFKEIKSASNSLLKLMRKLHTKAERRQSGLFLLEGKKLINDAIERGIEINDAVISTSFYEDEIHPDFLGEIESISVVSDALFKDLYTTSTSCGIIATAAQPDHTLEDCFNSKEPLLVIGEAIQDPGNLGTIMRNAFAFGADALILSNGSVDCFSPKVVRSSMGAIFDIIVVQDIDLPECVEHLHDRKIRLIALDADGQYPYWEESPYRPCALVFGNEGNGLSNYIKETAQTVVKIPIADSCESLNVAVAVGVVLADAYKCKSQAESMPR
jgi:TrmH family RNA methyltransferase